MIDVAFSSLPATDQLTSPCLTRGFLAILTIISQRLRRSRILRPVLAFGGGHADELMVLVEIWSTREV